MIALARAGLRASGPPHVPLHGRFAVVTGGTGGIGRALADRLTAQGADVLVVSRRSGGRFPHRAVDLASLDSVAGLADALLAEGRPIDQLVLCAGVHVPFGVGRGVGRGAGRTADGHERHWQVNYLSSFLLVQRLLPLCLASQDRRVLYVASEAHRLASLPGARRLLGFWYDYARSKEAAVSFFLRLQELHPELTVRAASPGYVDTAIHRAKGGIARRVERAWSHPRPPHVVAREMLRAFDDDASVYRDRGRARAPAGACLDGPAGERLWRESLRAVRSHLPQARAPEWTRNYAGNVRGFVAPIERPTTVEELARIVRRVAEDGRSIKVVGRRHSYNDSFVSDGATLSLERFDRVLRFDPAARTITCEAGISIGALCEYVDQRGYALRWSGNFGAQTLAGALATGTHGYGRDGGVMSELVRAATVMKADGTLVHTSDERDLRALRLGVGALGALVDLTLAIEPVGPCRYQVACLRREAFTERVVELARAHQYLRFVRNPFDARYVLYVTIDRLTTDDDVDPAPYIADGEAVAPALLVPLLRMPALRKLAGRMLAVRRHGYALRVPFSCMLFIRSGVVESHAGLAKVGAMALDRPDWLNMELAVPLERYARFERLFAEQMPELSRLSRRRPYFTCRFVGASTNVALGPNLGRDVVFCDIHADQRAPSSIPFLRGLEAAARTELSARPHWGKVFFAERPELAALYPAASFEEFAEVKRRLDPDAVFSSAFTRRTLGL